MVGFGALPFLSCWCCFSTGEVGTGGVFSSKRSACLAFAIFAALPTPLALGDLGSNAAFAWIGEGVRSSSTGESSGAVVLGSGGVWLPFCGVSMGDGKLRLELDLDRKPDKVGGDAAVLVSAGGGGDCISKAASRGRSDSRDISSSACESCALTSAGSGSRTPFMPSARAGFMGVLVPFTIRGPLRFGDIGGRAGPAAAGVPNCCGL